MYPGEFVPPSVEAFQQGFPATVFPVEGLMRIDLDAVNPYPILKPVLQC
jgi:hypothetical protein